MRPVAAAVVAILLLACGALTEPVASTVLFPGLGSGVPYVTGSYRVVLAGQDTTVRWQAVCLRWRGGPTTVILPDAFPSPDTLAIEPGHWRFAPVGAQMGFVSADPC